MKKTVTLLLCVLLTLSLLAACNGNNTTATTDPTVPTTDPTQPKYDVITIEKALELCGAEGNITTERYYIRGTITAISNPQYGAMTIQDATGSISVYGTYSEDGSIGYAEMQNKPYKGDEVLLHCILQNYNGTKEVKNARLIEFVHNEPQVDPSQYQDMTVAEARAAVAGTKIKVDGTVAAITYANGQIPSGVILMDNTGSIYLYDRDLAGRVQKGNQITVIGAKTYWILESEQNNAQKFGYKGCNQLEELTLLENNNQTDGQFDKSWIQETTIKAILDTSVTEDITTQIFKVTAKVEKKPGSGFTNYYFYDLDGTTSSYAYTQCNGKDFEWLDAFDGKICTVYLTPLNAKSTASDCYFRFLPVLVEDEGFTFDQTKAAEHVVMYNGLTQFLANYSGNPHLELVTNVDSQLLGFTGAKLTYTSDNTAVVSFEEVDGKVYMNCGDSGKATITVTGTHNGNTFSKTMEITVSSNQAVDSVNVAGAIAAPLDQTVTVKGIVGPSLVNQTGFYLIDESGVIAVLTDADTLKTLKPGYEVVLSGTRFHKMKDGSADFGQTCIKDATVVSNSYGSHTYSEATFISDKTLSDLAALDKAQDYTTNVYVVKAKVVVEETQYSKNIYLMDGDTKFMLYCSGANQYAFLQAYADQEVTVEIAPCNWNSKGYKGCVLAVRLADGTKIVNELNFQ